MGWLVLNPFSFFYSFFFRGESCIWSPCFLFIVIQIRIFRWNYSLNNFRLLRFVDIGLFIGGKYGAKYFSHETATSSSISRIYIFSWDKFFNNFHLVHQHFFSLEHFFLFFVRLSYVWTRFLFLYFEHWIFCRLLV